MLYFHHEPVPVRATQRDRFRLDHILENMAYLDSDSLHLQVRELGKIESLDQLSMNAQPKILHNDISGGRLLHWSQGRTNEVAASPFPLPTILIGFQRWILHQ